MKTMRALNQLNQLNQPEPNKLKIFRINGRAVNKRGLTVGITQDVQATSDKEAVAEVIRLTTLKGFPASYIRIVLVREVQHV